MSPIMLTRVLRGTVEAVAEELTQLLKAEGFSVFSRVDLRARLWERLGKEIPPAVILGVGCASLVYEAFVASPGAAPLLPCQAVVRDAGEGRVTVEVARPSHLLGALGDEQLRKVAAACEAGLARALEKLAPFGMIGPCSTSASPASSPSS